MKSDWTDSLKVEFLKKAQIDLFLWLFEFPSRDEKKFPEPESITFEE